MKFTRRAALKLTGQAALATALAPQFCFGDEKSSPTNFGAVVGEPSATKVGEKFLAEGGNAIDAAIATAFAAGITSPGKSGIGGYGGHAIIALANGKVRAIDFNAMAPASAREDMFPLDEKGRVKNKLNFHGWLAPGVPGTLAGLELALSRFGTRSLRDVLAPAIQLCEEGVVVQKPKGPDDATRNDPRPESVLQASQASALQKQRNLPLAKLLRILSQRNSGESFYRGDIAKKIAEAFKKNGGLVTEEDLAAYRARELDPLKIKWNGFSIFTPPLTSPGAQILEAALILKELGWEKLSALERLHAKIEALRIGWVDRFEFFGDPEKVKIPLDRLLSKAYAEEMADKVRAALKNKNAVPLNAEVIPDDGTLNISAVDKHGNMAAITLTHGSTLGARVSVEEFGMFLGHGMWRFDPRPGRPNSVGPRKRPVHNMCPSAVTRDGKPVLAVGAAGGLRIQNAIYEVLINFAGLGASMEKAMAAPRVQNNGTMNLSLEKGFSEDEEKYLKQAGYKLSSGMSAFTGAVSFDPKTRKCSGAFRGGTY